MIQSDGPEALLPYLMRCFPSLFAQNERLVVQGLGFFLRQPAASDAVARLVGVDGPITWQVEVPIRGGSIDLVGWDGAGLPRVVVEAKLSHVFDAGQLRYYGDRQERKLAGHDLASCALVVLAPTWRRGTGEALLVQHVIPHLAPRRFAYLGIEDVLEAVGPVLPDDPYRNWEHLLATYGYCEGTQIGPFSLEETTGAWERRADDYRRLALALTDHLQHPLFERAGLPRLAKMPPWTLGNYRYLWLPAHDGPAIGLFPDLGGVPFAVRFNSRYTKDLRGIAARLRDAGFLQETDPATGHVSVRLHVPAGASHYEMLAALGAQVEAILGASYPDIALPNAA